MITAEKVNLLGRMGERFDEILTPGAVDFVIALEAEFGDRRRQLLAERDDRRARLRAGGSLDFLPSTALIRDDRSWQVARPAPDLVDRRVEITGPPERKMTVNALNSGAQVWMADFEDASCPTWDAMVTGQLNLRDAIEGRLDFTSAEGKRYRVEGQMPAVMVRPRGWHLPEHHVRLDGRSVSASLFDFGLFFFHCANAQIERGSGPYFYLPKLESHQEARLWNDVFCFAQDELAIPRGTIRATVLIETISAAFEMDEILYELREHSAGLNAGRWDYIFSVIKNFGTRREYVLPDRSRVTMTSPFLRAYSQLLVQTCHRRGAHAIGGMAAFIPSRDPAVNDRAFTAVRADKTREAGDGFDGSWVAHPGLVSLCRDTFDARLAGRPNQLLELRGDVHVTAADLLAIVDTPGDITLRGVRGNIRIALRYIEAWLGGSGAVTLDNIMEDTATAEIARAQVWQWLHAGCWMEEDEQVTRSLVMGMLDEETERAGAATTNGSRRNWRVARTLLAEMLGGTAFTEALTLPGYDRYISSRT
jgi:malate synthase